MTRVAVLADLGQQVYHVGDEAMGHAAVDKLRRRGHDVVLLSRDPAQTRRIFGHPAVPTLQFPWSPAEREDYLRRIRADGGAQLPPGDPALALRAELESVDALLIAGGGNLNSRYGWLLYERAAVAAVARSLGKPVVVSGQTLGPVLTAQDAGVLAGMLRDAALVGVRESTSARLAADLGVAAERGLDDASFLADPPAPGAGSQEAESAPGLPAGPGLRDAVPEGPYVAVTLAPGGDAGYRRALAGALDRLHARTQLPTVFVPHMDVPGSSNIDGGIHADVAALMGTPHVLTPIADARSSASLTRGASLVVSTRYHPAVFALAAGIPAVALAVDAYSDARLRGAMENWGLADFVLALPALQGGLLDDALAEAWERRGEITAHLAGLRASLGSVAEKWWDAVAAVLADPEAARQPAGFTAPAALPATGSWKRSDEDLRRRFYPQSLLEARQAAEDERVRSHAAPLEQALEEERAAHGRLAGSRTVRTALAVHRVYSRLRPGR